MPDRSEKSKTPPLWLIVITSIVLSVLFGLLVWYLLCPQRRGESTDYIQVDRDVKSFLDQSTPDDITNIQIQQDNRRNIMELEENKH